MSVIAVVNLSGIEQRDDMIELGAFYVSDNELNGEIRGSRRFEHVQTQSGSVDRYMAYITIYGNAGDLITFKLYNHELAKELDYVTEQTITFTVDGTIGNNEEPFVIDFDKFVADNEGFSELTQNDNVIINANLSIEESNNIVVKSLKISEDASLTIKEGGVLTVTENITNEDVNALIIEEGGQLIHNNAGVAAIYKNNIVVPSNPWGEEDNTGWQFVSSPVENISTDDFIPTAGDYDLYMYDGTSETQWKNFKQMGSVTYDFNKSNVEDWTTIDEDGDGLVWKHYYYPRPLTGYFYSESYGDDGDINAENYLVSPKVYVNRGTKLSFKAKVGYIEIPETFKVLLSKKSNTEVSDFTYELESYEITNNEFTSFTIDLSDYAGNEVYIAFYHYVKEYGSLKLIIDDVQFINDNVFEKGRGYLVSYQNEEDIAEFKGNLNYLASDNPYQINFKYHPNTLAQFNLVGNPFAFDIDWSKNVETNNVYDGFATLDAKQGRYVYNSSGTIKAGEGFMVRTMEGGYSYITFKRDVAKYYRNENNNINITASSNKGSDNLIIRFDEEEISGFPKLVNFNDKIASIYVKEENTPYAIRNYNNDVNEIPIYFDAVEMGTYTLSFDIEGNFEDVCLLDKKTGECVNLLLENEYSFIAGSDDTKQRFILKFDNGQQSTDNSHFAYINNGNLIVDAEGSVQIIDMMGRVVIAVDNHGGIINISNLKDATYIVRCVNENEVKTQKIVVL